MVSVEGSAFKLIKTDEFDYHGIFDSKFHTTCFSGDLSVALLHKRGFSPYVSGGIGLLHETGTIGRNFGFNPEFTKFSNNNFAVVVAGGAKFYLSKRFAVRGELRYTLDATTDIPDIGNSFLLVGGGVAVRL
jgi:opacity protein-like surface antigen